MSHGPHAAVRRKAAGLLVLSTFFWGLSFPLIKALVLLEPRVVPQASEGLLVAGVLAPRFLLSVPILAAWLWARRGRDPHTPLIRRGEARQGLFVGLFATVAMLLQSDGLRFTAASTSAFLTQFYAITIPMWVALRRRTIPPLTVWMSCLLVLAGVAIIGHVDWVHLRLGRGELETILASVFFMGQILWLEHPAFERNRPAPMTLAMLAVEAVAFGALGFATAPHASALLLFWRSPAWVALTGVLTLACTIVAYLLMNAWQPKITATEAGVIYCAEPVFATLLSLFVPGWLSLFAGIDYPSERAGFALLVGGGLITAANVLIQRQPRPPQSAPSV